MAYTDGNTRTVLLYVEDDFAEPPDDWADGTAFLCIEPSFEGAVQQAIDNLNYRQRPYATREKVPTLRSGDGPTFGVYAHGRGGSAVAENAQVSDDYQNILMQNAWGGTRLGFRLNIAAGSTANIINAQAGQGANFSPGDVLFVCNSADGNRGRFVVIDSINVDAITLKTNVPFGSPIAADTGAAVITAFVNAPVLVNQNDAENTTLALLEYGEGTDQAGAEDVRQITGVKFNLESIEGLAPGEAVVLRFVGMFADHDNEGLTAPTGFDDPDGEAPVVTSTGADTFFEIATFGTAAMSEATEIQSLSITPGIGSQPVPALNGRNGRSGYTSGPNFDDTMIEVTVDNDTDWLNAWENHTQFHIKIQVDSAADRAIGWYFPRVELAEDPRRGISQDQATVALKFRAMEDGRATSATGARLQQYRSKILYMRSAPIV
jgi:hypothetical protein